MARQRNCFPRCQCGNQFRWFGYDPWDCNGYLHRGESYPVCQYGNTHWTVDEPGGNRIKDYGPFYPNGHDIEKIGGNSYNFG